MKLRHKLILSFLFCTASLVIVAYSGIYLTGRIATLITLSSKDLEKTIIAMQEFRSSIVDLYELGIGTHENTKGTLTGVEENIYRTKIQSIRRSRFEFINKINTESDTSLPSKIVDHSEGLIALLEETAAHRLIGSSAELQQSLNTELQTAIHQITTLLDIAIRSELKHAASQSSTNAQWIVDVRNLQYLIILLGMLASYAVAVSLAGQFSGPISYILTAVRQIGGGNLDIRLETSGNDELTELAETINQMVRELKKTTVSRVYLDKLFQSIPDALFVLDIEGRITSVNPAALSLLSYPLNYLEKRDFRSLVDDSRAENKIKHFLKKTSEGLNSFPVSLKTHFGSKIEVQLSAGRITDNNGEPSGYIFIAKDTREIKALELERDSYREQLRKSEQLASLGTVTALIAHKLNQPLTVIQLFIQRCIRENTESIQSAFLDEHLRECVQEVERASTAIRQVLSLSRTPYTAKRAAVQLRQTVDKVCLALEDQIQEKELRIHITGNWQNARILASAGELDSVFFFIIQNAIHASSTTERNTLEISCDREEEFLLVSFKDTCGGIADEHLDKIFEMFFTTKEIGEGTGLGLPIVKQAVQALGGAISVSSDEGVGTTFLLRFPRASGKNNSSDPEGGNHGKESILC